MKTISNQILASILLTILIVFGTWGYIEIRNTTSHEEEILAQDQTRIVERLAFNLVYPIWNLNVSELEKNIKNEALNENAKAILVYDEYGELYAGYIREELNDSVKKFDSTNAKHMQLLTLKQRYISCEIIYKQKVIGKVILYANEKPLQILIKKLKFNLFLKLIILIFVIAGVQFIILRKLVIRPLSLLKN